MSVGLLALLDDVAALIKASAVALDDIPAQVGKTTSKVSGIVIDDAAVTPKYVVGLSPKRELAIIYQIARRSLVNKLLFLAPAALVLGFFAPWIITPILMVGGAYLCFEGYEKVHSLFVKAGHEEPVEAVEEITPEELEKMRVKSATQTDFILSAEIIAIAYAGVADKGLLTQVIVLLCIAIGITIGVYGAVGLIVKADDFGVYLARRGPVRAVKALGRGIVRIMPHFLVLLGYVGTAAMLWVGAEIIAHGIPPLHHGLQAVEAALAGQPALAWLAKAVCCALGGLVIGWAVEKLVLAVAPLKARFFPGK